VVDAGGYFQSGYMIDKQMSETMAESGIAFVAAQLVLAGFVAMFGDKKNGRKATHLPGGAKAVVIAAIAFVGTEVLGPWSFRQRCLGGGLLQEGSC